MESEVIEKVCVATMDFAVLHKDSWGCQRTFKFWTQLVCSLDDRTTASSLALQGNAPMAGDLFNSPNGAPSCRSSAANGHGHGHEVIA